MVGRTDRPVPAESPAMSRSNKIAVFRTQPTDTGAGKVRFSNRPFEVKRFQTIHYHSVDVAHGLVLLFGIGTKALPSWDSKTGWNNLSGGLGRQCDGRSKRTYDLTPSIVPRGTSFHRSVELEFPPIRFDPVRFSCCCRGLFPGPPELGAVDPYAVHDHGEPTSQRHDCLFHSAAPGDLHRPCLGPRPFL
jgi:hypothetical protein